MAPLHGGATLARQEQVFQSRETLYLQSGVGSAQLPLVPLALVWSRQAKPDWKYSYGELIEIVSITKASLFVPLVYRGDHGHFCSNSIGARSKGTFRT